VEMEPLQEPDDAKSDDAFVPLTTVARVSALRARRSEDHRIDLLAFALLISVSSRGEFEDLEPTPG